MFIWRVFGLAITVASAALVAFLWLQMLDKSGQTLFIHRAGIPLDLLLATLGLCGVIIGLHLAFRVGRRRKLPGQA